MLQNEIWIVQIFHLNNVVIFPTSGMVYEKKNLTD